MRTHTHIHTWSELCPSFHLLMNTAGELMQPWKMASLHSSAVCLGLKNIPWPISGFVYTSMIFSLLFYWEHRTALSNFWILYDFLITFYGVQTKQYIKSIGSLAIRRIKAQYLPVFWLVREVKREETRYLLFMHGMQRDAAYCSTAHQGIGETMLTHTGKLMGSHGRNLQKAVDWSFISK